MKWIIFLLSVFSLVFLRNSHSIDQNISSNSISYNKTIKLFSSNNEIHLGQISGLAISTRNPKQLSIYHRGSREWNEESFPDGYHFDTNKFGVIRNNTILTIDIESGGIINEWGNNSFYMPHGLFVDNEDNIWLTDVAMHQVFKYANGQRILTLGELFIPGDDALHFCKPTDVVLSNDRSFLYVADGYCNSRIVKFDSNGTFIQQYRIPQGEKQLFIPHSLILIESLHLICVADRQNGRIVCFDTDKSNEGEVKHMIEYPSMNTVYAITYHRQKNLLYAVSGKDPFNHQALGFTFSVHPQSFGQLIQTWKASDEFGEPHDLALSIDGQSLFVGSIRPNRIHLFNILSLNNDK